MEAILDGLPPLVDGFGHPRVLALVGLLLCHFFPRRRIKASGLVGLFLDLG